MAGDYLQLGPNDYVQFPDGLDQAGKQKFAEQAMASFQQLSQQQKGLEKFADNSTANIAYAQQRGMSPQEAGRARSAEILKGMTTPGQVLQEENNPITSGLKDVASEAVAGGGQALSGNGLFE